MRVAGLLQRNCCMQGGGGCLKTVKAVFYKLNMPHHTDLHSPLLFTHWS